MLRLLDSLKSITFFKLVVIYLRYVIGFAFVFASIVKIRGERFTSLPVDTPVGYFFEAMYQSGFYWNFLGWSQFIAGALMMTQRFATVGAMMFLPIILNVTLITHSVDFGSGTPLITSLMLLGTLFLVLWDYPKWAILFQRDHHIRLDMTQTPEDRFMTHPVWVITGCLFIVLTIGLNGLLFRGHNIMLVSAGMLLFTGIAAFVYMMIWLRRSRHLTAGSPL